MKPTVSISNNIFTHGFGSFPFPGPSCSFPPPSPRRDAALNYNGGKRSSRRNCSHLYPVLIFLPMLVSCNVLRLPQNPKPCPIGSSVLIRFPPCSEPCLLSSMSSSKIVAEYAKSDRSSCKKCSKSILANSLRLGLVSRDPRGFDATKWHHLECFPRKTQPITSVEKIKGFDALKNFDQEALRKLEGGGGDDFSKELPAVDEAGVDEAGVDDGLGNDSNDVKVDKLAACKLMVHKMDESERDEDGDRDIKKPKSYLSAEADNVFYVELFQLSASDNGAEPEIHFSISEIKNKYKDDGLHDSEKIAAFDFDGCLANTSVKRYGDFKCDNAQGIHKGSCLHIIKQYEQPGGPILASSCMNNQLGVRRISNAFTHKSKANHLNWSRIMDGPDEFDQFADDSENRKLKPTPYVDVLVNEANDHGNKFNKLMQFERELEKVVNVIFTNESNIERWKNKRQQAVDSKIGRLNNFIKSVKVPVQGHVSNMVYSRWELASVLSTACFPVDSFYAEGGKMLGLNRSYLSACRSFYVGDAAGRANDHSDADIKFAKWMVPQQNGSG
ncbi:hypothetical protein ACLOJK_010012 [Asimina triloba]